MTIKTQTGEVLTAQVDVGDKKEKLMWGPIGPIMQCRQHIDCLYIECTNYSEPVTAEALEAIQLAVQQPGQVRVVFYGDPGVKQQLRVNMLASMNRPGLALAGFKVKMVWVHLPKEDEIYLRRGADLAVTMPPILL